jgi:hypothetical protein
MDACAKTSWNEERAREAMAKPIAEGVRRTCMVCGGLEADDDPHQGCRS